MAKKKYITEPSEFYELLMDDALDNLNIQLVSDEMVQMTYNFKDQFVDNSTYASLALRLATQD